jgi:hypothetical protein
MLHNNTIPATLDVYILKILRIVPEESVDQA